MIGRVRSKSGRLRSTVGPILSRTLRSASRLLMFGRSRHTVAVLAAEHALQLLRVDLPEADARRNALRCGVGRGRFCRSLAREGACRSAPSVPSPATTQPCLFDTLLAADCRRGDRIRSIRSIRRHAGCRRSNDNGARHCPTSSIAPPLVARPAPGGRSASAPAPAAPMGIAPAATGNITTNKPPATPARQSVIASPIFIR